MADVAQTSPYLRSLSDYDRNTYLEQAIFARSPVNQWWTALFLFAAIYGLFALAAASEGMAWIVQLPDGPALEPRAWAALTLTLIVVCALAVQRYARIRECEESPLLAKVLTPAAVARWTFPITGLVRATVIGAVVGAAISVLLYGGVVAGGWRPGPALEVWFGAATVLVSVLFARGVALTRAGARAMAAVIEEGLVVDLLQVDQLYGWGRAAARTSLIWFAVSAASLLFFFSDGVSPPSLAIMFGCAGMGVWVFVDTMRLVHRKIRAAKTAELETVRGEIADLRRRLDAEPQLAAKLQGLLAWEARIATVQEWPFDQTIAVRVAASALLLTVPWFGQAIAGAVVERLSAVMR